MDRGSRPAGRGSAGSGGGSRSGGRGSVGSGRGSRSGGRGSAGRRRGSRSGGRGSARSGRRSRSGGPGSAGRGRGSRSGGRGSAGSGRGSVSPQTPARARSSAHACALVRSVAPRIRPPLQEHLHRQLPPVVAARHRVAVRPGVEDRDARGRPRAAEGALRSRRCSRRPARRRASRTTRPPSPPCRGGRCDGAPGRAPGERGRSSPRRS